MYKYIIRLSLSDAIQCNEKEQWRESFRKWFYKPTMQDITLIDEREIKREGKSGREMEESMSWEERTTNKQCGGKYHKQIYWDYQAMSIWKMPSSSTWTLAGMNPSPLCTQVTSAHEDKGERALDGALGDTNKYGQFSEYFNVLPSLCPTQQAPHHPSHSAKTPTVPCSRREVNPYENTWSETLWAA